MPERNLWFSVCQLKDVSAFVKEHHYSKTHHLAATFAFALFLGGVLAGACLFGMSAGNPKCMTVLRGYDDPKDYLELQRLVLLDEVPKNSESQFIGWCLRWLKKNTNIKAVISFADPRYGHTGTIYRASNWIYLGKQKPMRDRIFINGEEWHPKQLYNRFGTSSIKKLQGMGIEEITTTMRESKHKYAYILQTRALLKESEKLFDKTSA